MEIIKKHLITILCILSIILLALPLANVVCTLEMFGTSSESATTVTGFTALKNSVFAYVLILGPILLIAMNYIKQLEPHKGILAIAVPIICLISLVIVVIQAKSFSSSASNDYASADISLKIGFGSILVSLTHIATIVAGGVTFHNFTLDKNGLEKLKSSATDIINTAQDKVSAVVHEGSHLSKHQQTFNEKTICTDNNEAATTTKIVQRKPTNLNRMSEVLALIEKLAQMKAAGVLTEEEFSEKKKQLLEEIQ